MLHLVRGTAVKWPLVEHQLPGDDAEAPPVNAPGVAFLANDLRSHVRHAARDTRVQPPLRVMDRDVEVCDVHMPHRVQQDVVGLEVAASGRETLHARNMEE